MKKIISLALCAAMSLGLFGCMGRTPSQTSEPQAPQEDLQYVLPQPTDANAAQVNGQGAVIAYVADAAGLEDGGRNAALWQGVQAFSQTFHFTAQSFTAETAGPEGARDALAAAAESGAGMVVCAGEDMAVGLYDMQGNYPTVSYLLLDGEPHNADYTAYTTASNVHCALFQEEQAAFLAGYAVVADGNTSLGFLGAEALPEIVRSCTGFLQGAQAAAEQTGEQVTFKIWYSGVEDANEDVTARVSGWYADGTQTVMAAGGNLTQSAVEAAASAGGKVVAVGADQAALGSEVLTTATKNYCITVQNQLYGFYAGGNVWGKSFAGQSERVGVTAQAVGLSMTSWRFAQYTLDEYESLYEQLRTSAVKVERYSDMGSLPQTPSVTVTIQN